ncbi:hypothetical protein K933_11991, partial [Candidatus Halobonum tyrrellensis G22]
MRDTLEALAAGELSPAEAESRLRGYATTDVSGDDEDDPDGRTRRHARFDAARETRRGIPEGIYAAGKTPAETAALAATAVETTGRALVTRADDRTAGRVRSYLRAASPGVTVDRDTRARTVLAETPTFDPPRVDADV